MLYKVYNVVMKAFMNYTCYEHEQCGMLALLHTAGNVVHSVFTII